MSVESNLLAVGLGVQLVGLLAKSLQMPSYFNLRLGIAMVCTIVEVIQGAQDASGSTFLSTT